jgi:hypothetical protein
MLRNDETGIEGVSWMWTVVYNWPFTHEMALAFRTWLCKRYRRGIKFNYFSDNNVSSTALGEPGSSVSIVFGYGLGDRGSIPGRGERIFPLTSVSIPALGPTQPPVQWVPGVLSPGVKRGRGVTLTTHPHLVPRSRISRNYTASPPKRLHGVWCDSFSFYYCFETFWSTFYICQ